MPQRCDVAGKFGDMIARLAPGGSLHVPVPAGRNVFLYVVRGELRVGGKNAPAHHLVELGEGDSVALEADVETVALFGHADPIGEPVVSYGPFVMNTRAEIEQAIADYRAGKFGAM